MSKKYRELFIGFYLLLIAAFFALTLGADYFLGIPGNATAYICSNPKKTIYKAIPSSDPTNPLIGFELHNDVHHTTAMGCYTQCSVIVRDLDPRKDNYKTMCKEIVGDVIGTYGARHITINIFDSFEAYSLSLSDNYSISPEEENMINNHKVAVYDSLDLCDDGSVYLSFYPDADNGLAEKITYL